MNNEILWDLKGENNTAFRQIYKAYFGMVNRFVTNISGKTNDAEDLFQDTMTGMRIGEQKFTDLHDNQFYEEINT